MAEITAPAAIETTPTVDVYKRQVLVNDKEWNELKRCVEGIINKIGRAHV